MVKVEYTTRIQTVGNSCCVVIPKMQLNLLKVGKGDAIKITIEKVKE